MAEPGDRTDDEIRDVLALTDLSLGYATALEEQDWRRVEAMFTPHAISDVGDGPTLVGGTAFRDWARATFGGADRSQHLHANLQFEPQGDRASGRFYTYITLVRIGPCGDTIYAMGGTYNDEYVRTPRGWCVDRRSFRMIWGRGDEQILGRGAPSNGAR
jgi:hypothetical protein